MKNPFHSMFRLGIGSLVILVASVLCIMAPAADDDDAPAQPGTERAGENPQETEADHDPETEIMATNGVATNMLQEPLPEVFPPVFPEETAEMQPIPGESAPGILPPPVAPPVQVRPEQNMDRRQDSSSRSRTYGSSRERSDSGASASSRESTIPGPVPPDFAAFGIITERNIFDPNRRARRSPVNTPRPQPRAVDSFKLVGVMSYERGKFAFFDSSKAEFRKALKISDEIAGFQVAAITGTSVKLKSAEKEILLNVGSQLRREESGPWEPSNAPAEQQIVTQQPPETAPAASGQPDQEADDVLKRLMQRREQE
jgi:hypothetical protein